jgi:hypothetical protein
VLLTIRLDEVYGTTTMNAVEPDVFGAAQHGYWRFMVTERAGRRRSARCCCACGRRREVDCAEQDGVDQGVEGAPCTSSRSRWPCKWLGLKALPGRRGGPMHVLDARIFQDERLCRTMSARCVGLVKHMDMEEVIA